MKNNSKLLMEDFKNGNLNPNYYYIIDSEGDVVIEYAGKWYDRNGDCRIGFDYDEDIKDILSPVPSYRKYKKIKKLLKKCRGELFEFNNEHYPHVMKLVKNINSFLENF